MQRYMQEEFYLSANQPRAAALNKPYFWRNECKRLEPATSASGPSRLIQENIYIYIYIYTSAFRISIETDFAGSVYAGEPGLVMR